MVAAPLRRRACAAALALFCAGFLSTCDFLTADIFPSWFSYVEARYDLRSAVSAFTPALASSDFFVVEYLETYSGNRVVAILIMGTTNKRLLLLHPDTLERLTFIDNPEFSPFLAAASVGNEIVSGKVAVNLSTLSPTGTGPTVGLNGSKQGIMRTGPGGDQFLICFVENVGPVYEIQRYKYSSLWAPSGSDIGTTWALPYPSSPWQMIDSETSESGIGAMFLLNHATEAEQSAYLSYFPSTFTINTGTLDFLNDPAAQVTGPFRVDDGRAWITYDGPVAYHRGDKGPDRLVRYKMGSGSASPYTPATELDSIPFDDNDELRVLSFDASGTWWFAYDRRTGYLYKLRTWWK